MKRYLLYISFDGTAYHGWQVQPGVITVQQVLNESLLKLLGKETAVTGCSRTDTGVHARQFTCHIDCCDNIPKEAFLKGLNSILPDDIAVIGCKEVSSDFHARYSAKGKMYIYGMYIGNKNAFDERYFLRLDGMPNINKMNQFAKTLIGTHDFYGFSASGRSVEDTVRTISDCEVSCDESGKIFFKISGDGFLYNMVRILAGTALSVGYGKLPVNIAEQVFAKKDRSLAGDTLPGKALVLEKVFY